MRSNIFEIIVGTFVLASAVYFFIFSLKKSETTSDHTYRVYAEFDSIEGIGPGSDIKISGVKVGTVSESELNDKTYRAKLKLSIYQKVRLPKDSSAKIASSGLLGGKFLSIEPGAEEETLKSGDIIEFTQSSINFEDLLGKFIFGSSKKESEAK